MSTLTRSNILSYSAYALLGAGDLVLDQARKLTERRDELPQEALTQVNEAVENLRKAVDNALEELGEQTSKAAQEAGNSLDELAERGRMLFERLSREGDVKEARTDVEQARQGVLGAITAIRNGATTAISRLKAAGTLSGDAAESVIEAAETVVNEVAGTRHDKPLADHTKAELYELATARDIDGRSSMTKDELVAALKK